MDIEIQKKFRSYLDILYPSISRVRMLIQMSIQIGEYHRQFISKNFWGFLQNNLIIGSVVVEVFSLFDNKNDSMIKKLAKLLKLHGQNYVTSSDIIAWIQSIKKYDDFRHKILAHKDLNPPRPEKVMYIDFLTIIDELDRKLFDLENNHLNEINSLNQERIVSSLSSNSRLLLELKSLLSKDCHSKKVIG